MNVSASLAREKGTGNPALRNLADYGHLLLLVTAGVLLIMSVLIDGSPYEIPMRICALLLLSFGQVLSFAVLCLAEDKCGLGFPPIGDRQVLYEQNLSGMVVDESTGKTKVKQYGYLLVVTADEIWTKAGVGSFYDNRIHKRDIIRVAVCPGWFRTKFRITFHASRGRATAMLAPRDPASFAAALDHDGNLQSSGRWKWNGVVLETTPSSAQA